MLARRGFLHVENVFGRQRRHQASLGDRAGYLDRLLTPFYTESQNWNPELERNYENDSDC